MTTADARRVTIVMYHYVRDLARSRYPAIKGLTTDNFRAQLDYLASRYTLIGADALLAATRGESDLPPNAAVLTFDDGYTDHYATVFPLLDERKLQGLFFVPAQVVLEHTVLDVNKIHFVLATLSGPGEHARLVEHILDAVRAAPRELGLDAPEAYRARYAVAARFDPAETMFVKRMLQSGLPDVLRRSIIDDLFRTHVTRDEAAFASELYASIDQLRLMRRAGMYVGAHGHQHGWLDKMSDDDQVREIDRSIEFLAMVGTPTTDWIMCYPYGRWDERLLGVLRSRSCGLGLTTKVAIANLATDDPLLLPRLDTNDFPPVGAAT